MNDPTTHSNPISPDLCPVCGLSNRCTLADPRSATKPCWCFAVSIDLAVLEALPEAVRNQACLCPGCARIEVDSHSPRSD
ncbi:cysteine-rich CWC family protein [Pseudomonas sp. NA-150]|uniref:cysteine-rich CWC family protein n=1 Tax=Pseudomonas sp. NA-150 TaxID=3367525 RepID=UPI0037CA7A40